MSKGSEELINHYGLIRLRIEGSGTLKMTLRSLSGVKTKALADLTLVSSNNIEPTKLTNFTQQRAQLELKTTSYGENFICSKIVIFARPVANSLPG